MTLEELLKNLDALGEDSTICALRPWTADTEALLVIQLPGGGLPPAVKDTNFEYFLEVLVAKEVLEGHRPRPLSVEEKIRYLIYYAENDAYPNE